MARQIRLDFPVFCTSYITNRQTSNRLKGEHERSAFKRCILAQLAAKPSVRAHPLTFDFTFWSIKDYPVYNYTMMAQWILETMTVSRFLQDINSGVVAEIRVRQKLITNTARQGCEILISRYEKPKCATSITQ